MWRLINFRSPVHLVTLAVIGIPLLLVHAWRSRTAPPRPQRAPIQAAPSERWRDVTHEEMLRPARLDAARARRRPRRR